MDSSYVARPRPVIHGIAGRVTIYHVTIGEFREFRGRATKPPNHPATSPICRPSTATVPFGPRFRGRRHRLRSTSASGPLFLFFLFSRLGGFGGRNDLVGLELRDVIVVVELHVEGGAALRHGGEVVLVVEHFRHGDHGANELGGTLGFHAGDAAAAAVEVAHQVAGVLDGGLDLNVHDGFEQGRFGFQHAGLEGFSGGQFESQLGGIDVVVRAVVNRDLEIDHGVTGQVALLGGIDDALFDGGAEVFGGGACA